jgi:ubiquinone/menaquinone biosynthesis C-methylase UbiE
LAQRRPDLALTGIDIDRGVLSIAQRRLKSAILICGNVAEVPLKDGSADFIFSTIMFHHLERELKIKAFKEAMRLRKDSGHFYLCDFSLPTNVLGRLVVKTLGSLEQGVKSQARGELLEIANGIGLRAVELRRYLGSIALYEISR